MKREGIYLRPTGLWILFGPILGCMWLAAVNYSNNLVYGVLYLVASLTFLSVFYTWRNLASLQVEHVRVSPAFAGEDVPVEIFLRNTAEYPIFGLTFARLGDSGDSRRATLLPIRGGVARIEGKDTLAIECAFPSARRGVYRFDALRVRASYPLGLFWAAFRVAIDAEFFVYPQPRGGEAWPDMPTGGGEGYAHSQKPGDDFSGVRAYAPGESLRHVDWKAYARGRPLSVKQFTGGEGQELWLDAAHLHGLPLEARLSQLALWIVNAEKAKLPYALRLGRTTLPLGLGPVQSRRALEALAVAGPDS